MTTLPKFHDTFMPILEVLKDEQVYSRRELMVKVRDTSFSHLPADLLALKTKSDQQLIQNRIGWGLTYLKVAKIIHQPKRATFQITEKGKTLFATGVVTLELIKNDEDYVRHELNKKQSQATETIEETDSLSESSPEDLIDKGVTALEEQSKADLLDYLKQVDPYLFEKIVLVLFKKMGYGDFQETSKSNDGGIDGVINQDQLGLEKIYVQAKRYSDNKVRETDIRNFIGAMSGDTSKGIFVTTSSFDEKAKVKAKEAHHKIILIDGYALANYMYKYGVGVQLARRIEIKSIDEDFFEGL